MDPFEFADQVDTRVDEIIAKFKDKKSVRIFSGVFSNLGDYGLIWAVIYLYLLIAKPNEWKKLTFKISWAGFTVLFMNKVAKSVFKRRRPDKSKEIELLPSQVDATRPKWVRPSTSSSFPSGHSAAAFAASTVLSHELNIDLHLLSILIAISRVTIGDHHASDVLVGAFEGYVLGLLGNKIAGIVFD
ncbi:MAG: phosphatase PAP2 family protein [Acidimicrobiales bacterium]|nr:phosphatase PAP2 family protein [Acidimicrobiales bacterium]